VRRRAIKGQGGPDAWAQGRERAAGVVGSARARPEVEDDDAAPHVGGSGRRTTRAALEKWYWAVLGRKVGARLSRRAGPREGKTSWATGEGLAGLKARKTRGGKGNALQIPKEFKQMNSNTGLNSTY
jgi:hypothetical protein